MSKFGWSYPPGCNYVPGDEVGAVDLTDLCDPLPTGVSHRERREGRQVPLERQP
jgi:hypothetical protein